MDLFKLRFRHNHLHWTSTLIFAHNSSTTAVMSNLKAQSAQLDTRKFPDSKKRVADDPVNENSSKKQKVHPFFSKQPDEPSEPSLFRWLKPNLGPKHSLLHGVNLNPKSSTKVAAFDLDNTVIKRSHWSRLTEGQWEWWTPLIPSKLKELHDAGYSVIIVSNQAQRVQAALKAWEEKKIPSIAAALPEVPFRIFGAKAKDGFRKPMPGIWYELEHIFDVDGVQIDKSASFFVGDAAGRSKDYSSCDRKWALNVGIPFLTPEEYFLRQPPKPYHLPGWKVSDVPISSLFTPTNTPLLPAPKSPQPELVLFVGLPCIGKTSFYRRHFQPGYKHINQDTLKRRDKCVQAVQEALSAGQSCVVDNTNRDIKTRKFYIDVAQKIGVSVRCFQFDGSVELAWHNNLYRAYNMHHSRTSGEPLRDLLPYSAITAYQKDYEEPTMSEGFTEIKIIHWVFEGDTDARRRWSMWLQLDGEQLNSSGF